MKTRALHIILFGITLSLLYGASHLDMSPKKSYGMPQNTNPVKIKDGFLYYDSLKLALNKIPKVKQLHTVSKKVMGKWYRMYTAIKIEESGNDGQNSYYARAYNNLVGMRYPRKRKTTAVRMGNDYYAVYANWYEGMIDFRYYIDYMEGSFERKYKRQPKNEKEFINHIYGSYNIYSKWKNDVFWILDRHPVMKDTL